MSKRHDPYECPGIVTAPCGCFVTAPLPTTKRERRTRTYCLCYRHEAACNRGRPAPWELLNAFAAAFGTNTRKKTR